MMPPIASVIRSTGSGNDLQKWEGLVEKCGGGSGLNFGLILGF